MEKEHADFALCFFALLMHQPSVHRPFQKYMDVAAMFFFFTPKIQASETVNNTLWEICHI